LIIKGLSGLNLGNHDDPIMPLVEAHNHDRNALIVLGGCHTLAMAEGTLVGDPIEKQAFEEILWKHDGRKTS
jgi:hypothetical protein